MDAIRQFHKNVPIECGIRKFRDNDDMLVYEIVFPDDFIKNVDPLKVKRKIEGFLFFDAPNTQISVVAESSHDYCFAIFHGFLTYRTLTDFAYTKNQYQRGQGILRYANYPKRQANKNANYEPDIRYADKWVNWAINNLVQKERKRRFANYYHPDKDTGSTHIFKLYWHLL